MKKILAVLDGLKYSESTHRYAVEMAKFGNTHLAGIFLEDFTYSSYKIYELIVKEGLLENKLREYEEKDKQRRDSAVHYFEKACKDAGIEYNVHRDKNIALQELLQESIYADMMIISSSESFAHHKEPLPTHFIKDLLGDTQCPVLLVPQTYQPIEKIFILYDGAPSSVHAIKMFSYLLPALNRLPVEVIAVKNPESDLHLPDNRLMKEFMKRHYPRAVYTVLKGTAETEIPAYLKKETKNTLIVCGAYRRNTVSRWFRLSMADVLMRELALPLFIAHNK